MGGAALRRETGEKGRWLWSGQGADGGQSQPRRTSTAVRSWNKIMGRNAALDYLMLFLLLCASVCYSSPVWFARRPQLIAWDIYYQVKPFDIDRWVRAVSQAALDVTMT